MIGPCRRMLPSKALVYPVTWVWPMGTQHNMPPACPVVLTLAANLSRPRPSRMPPACRWRHVSYTASSNQREAPRGKPAASNVATTFDCSCQRELPPGKPVASELTCHDRPSIRRPAAGRSRSGRSGRRRRCRPPVRWSRRLRPPWLFHSTCFTLLTASSWSSLANAVAIICRPSSRTSAA